MVPTFTLSTRRRLAGRLLVWGVLIMAAALLGVLAGVPVPQQVTAQGVCSEEQIYNSGGWVIKLCRDDPVITTPMQIVLDGGGRGSADRAVIYHPAQGGPGQPQVAIIYASGYVRLKQNADPTPTAIPFGSSFILGPAYWEPAGPQPYHPNPQLERLEFDTRALPGAPLRMRANGTNATFNVAYEMALPPPQDRQTRLHVTQAYTATANITIPATRRNQHEGFKLVQVSSMFINESGPCGGGHVGCHDSNAARYIGADLARRQVAFRDLTPPGFVFSVTQPLSTTWLDALHTDDTGWQGNTPNVRIALDALPTDRTITPQGYITATNDPNQENVALWLHDDGPASVSWQVGQSGKVAYWLLAQDNPPEPWADLGLRSGLTFQNFEGSYNCYVVLPQGRPVTATLTLIPGYTDQALRLNYSLGSTDGDWAQVRCDFSPPLNLAAYDHLRLDWGGSPAGNSLEVGLISQGHIFGRGYHHATHRTWWGQLVVPFQYLAPWTAGTTFDSSQVTGLIVSAKKDGPDDVGGFGSLALDNLNAYRVLTRTVPTAFATVTPNPTAAAAAAGWVARQQCGTGLVQSWQEETTPTPLAHLYDQALALLTLAHSGRWAEANDLAMALAARQNGDGSWFETYNCQTGQATTSSVWEGATAWAVYALSRYLVLHADPDPAAVITARDRAADWLEGRVQTDGCLVIDHTEGTIDVWWALQAAGRYQRAHSLRNCLLTQYWDDTMGRFKGGRASWAPYLDNQTWGAAFLRGICENDKARRALSYARETLLLPAQGHQVYGFDGQDGPWAVWSEAAGQYSAVGGPGANDLVQELLAQQREDGLAGAQDLDGALPGGPDEFSGGGVWVTRMHGVAPTAWLYFALTGGPFDYNSVALFTDVLPGDPFYGYIRCLVCQGIISGYNTNPPCMNGIPCYNGGANVTRGQIAKIVSNAAGFNDVIPSSRQTFMDVPNTHPFWLFIERAVLHNIISGYSTSPPCPAGQVPCFLPGNAVTRGQMAKIDMLAAGITDPIPSTRQTFTDVPYNNPFWLWIEQAALHNIISGYSTSPPCTTGTPCFLWTNNLTRNQTAKIVAQTFFPNCQAHAGSMLNLCFDPDAANNQ